MSHDLGFQVSSMHEGGEREILTCKWVRVLAFIYDKDRIDKRIKRWKEMGRQT